VYILALKFVLSFFFKVDGDSQTIESLFNYLLWAFVFTFIASGIVSVVMLVLAYAKNSVLLFLAVSIALLAIFYTYLFNFAGHFMFIIIPLIVVLYHVVIFTVFAAPLPSKN